MLKDQYPSNIDLDGLEKTSDAAHDHILGLAPFDKVQTKVLGKHFSKCGTK